MPAKAQLTCKTCGTDFYCSPSAVAAGRRYCSLQCRSADRFSKELPALNRTPVHFACKECGKDFVMTQSYLNAYIKKYGRNPLYCSIDCSAAGIRRDTDERHTFTCDQCGKIHQKRRKPGGRTYVQQRFCSTACKAEWQKARSADRFEAGEIGRHVKRGYVWLSIPANISNTGKKREMLEHRHVMEQHLGRPLLPEETVHHKRAWDKTCNDLTNLELRTGNHGPGGAVDDMLPWCAEMMTLYRLFITPEIRDQLRALIEEG